MSEEINSPVDNEALARMMCQQIAGDVTGDDELSSAVRETRVAAPVAVEVEKPKGPGKYQLDYMLHGLPIHETHETVRLALARVDALRRIGIIPHTSTAAPKTATA